MSAKSNRNRQNKIQESHILDTDLIEQRALQIARDEGREEISQDDRDRAQEELRAPNEVGDEPEISPGMEPQIGAWDEAPASSGRHVPNIIPEDEASIGKDLTEKGLREPNEDRRSPTTRSVGRSNTL